MAGKIPVVDDRQRASHCPSLSCCPTEMRIHPPPSAPLCQPSARDAEFVDSPRSAGDPPLQAPGCLELRESRRDEDRAERTDAWIDAGSAGRPDPIGLKIARDSGGL